MGGVLGGDMVSSSQSSMEPLEGFKRNNRIGLKFSKRSC